MAQPKFRGYDREGRLSNEPYHTTKFFGLVKGKWVAVWPQLVLTPPPIKRTEIDWEE